MKKAYFYIGLPGAGKSSDIKERFKDNLTGIISADHIKTLHSDYKPEKAHLVHQWSVEEAEKYVYARLDLGHNFIFDSGGINNNYSVRIMTAVKKAGYHITLIFVDTPVVECLNRVNNRKRKVPFDDIFAKSFKLKESLERQQAIADEFIHVPYYLENTFFFDMDGVMAAYEVYPIRCPEAPKDTKVDYINNNLFENASPVWPMINSIKDLQERGKKVFIISISPNDRTTTQKKAWLKRYLPLIEEDRMYFPGKGENKVSTLLQIMEKHKLTKRDIVYVDDLHEMLFEASNQGINNMHPSKFLAKYY